MARKVEKKPPVAERSSATDALQILSPDITQIIGGRSVTIREYPFFEGLEVAHRLAPLIADMTQLSIEGSLTYARIRRLIGVHKALVIPAAAQSAGVEAAWVAGLDGADAELFMSTWFAVNSSFFVHEVVVELRDARAAASLAATSTGSTPSPRSPMPDSAESMHSAGLPSDS